MKNDNLIIAILKDQVVPALGCTEPAAVAYAIAKAKELLLEEVKEVKIIVDKNVLKNGMRVGIPGTNEKGIIAAAALGIVAGKSQYELQALKDINNEDIDKAFEIINKNIIKLELNNDINGLYIDVNVKGNNGYVRIIIKNTHLNVILIEKNGETILQKEEEKKEEKKSLREEIKNFTVNDLINFANNVEYEKIEFINEGIVMNRKIADVGLNDKMGIGLGNFLGKDKENLDYYAKAATAAASEARMCGYPLPVMSSAGSGNHGLGVIIPISIIGEGKEMDKEKIVRAVTLSHLITIYVKSYTGSLSPVCGCAVAAGVGAAAGITYLLGGNESQIKGAINNMIAGVSGMICDGAKLGCAFKLCVSISSAIDCAKLAINNIIVPHDNGILDECIEVSMQNLGKLSNEGMNNTDKVILDIMLKNSCNL